MHRLEPLRLVHGALQLDLALLAVSALRQLDGHQPRLSLVLLRLDDEMRHALLERIDDDVRELAVHPVGAADAIANLEAHLSLLSTPTDRAQSTAGRRGGSSRLTSATRTLCRRHEHVYGRCMWLAGIPVADKAVLHLAASLREAELIFTAERLERAYDREARIVALDIPDREAILRVLEDCPEELAELRATLLRSTSGESGTASSSRARATVPGSGSR